MMTNRVEVLAGCWPWRLGCSLAAVVGRTRRSSGCTLRLTALTSWVLMTNSWAVLLPIFRFSMLSHRRWSSNSPRAVVGGGAALGGTIR